MPENRSEEISGKRHGDYERHKILVHFGYSFGGFILTAIVDYLFLWPDNHFAALLAIAAWLSVTAIVELTVWGFSPWITATAVAGLFVAACIANWIIGPIQPPETEAHGWLLPAHEPTPKTPCDGIRNKFPNSMTFLLGSNAALVPPSHKMKILTVGSCALISADADDAKLAINTDIFDTAHELVARIDQNEFHLVPGKYAYQTRSDDRSRLTVFDKQGKRLFSVFYMNRTTIRFGGVFYCADDTSAAVNDDGPLSVNSRTISGGSIGGNCTANSNGFFIQPNGTGL